MSDIAEKPQRFGEHANAFGFLRLLFASLVIVSHTPELVDGDRHRELLSRLVGTTSFGEFAVAGFFVISGFLITGSYVNSRSTRDYLVKRIARIYPAFVVASLFCLFVVAPLSGAGWPDGTPRAVLVAAVRVAALARPMVAGAFPGQNYNDVTTALNGAMWTIQYEFACYLLAIVLIAIGLHRWPSVLLLAAALLTAAARQLPDGALGWLSHAALFPGPPSALFRLVGMFMAGAGFYGLQQRLRFHWGLILPAAVGLALTLRVNWCADTGLALFGGYLIFAAAYLGGRTWMGKINNKNDISYGVYLYAWPVEQLLIRYAPWRHLAFIGLATWLAALLLGFLSWTLVEKPAMSWARQLLRRDGSPRGALPATT